MRPVKFPMANAIYEAPAGVSEDECGDLPVFEGPDNRKATCWELNREEIDYINRTGCLWITYTANGVPPMMLTAEPPALAPFECICHIETMPRLKTIQYLDANYLVLEVGDDEDNFRAYTTNVDGKTATGIEYTRKFHVGFFRDNLHTIVEPHFEILGRWKDLERYQWLGMLYALKDNHLLLKVKPKRPLIITGTSL